MHNSPEYHLAELRIARDPSDPRHNNPPPIPEWHKVLEVGCGAGQILMTACPGRTSFGLDVELDGLQFGKTLTGDVKFVCATGEALPFRPDSFDTVIARNSLPYTDLRVSLPEIRRVLRPGGQVWTAWNMMSFAVRSLGSAVADLSLKRTIMCLYTLVNGALFHFTQRSFRIGHNRYECFQTQQGLRRAFRNAGFRDVSVRKTRMHLTVTATRDGALG